MFSIKTLHPSAAGLFQHHEEGTLARGVFVCVNYTPKTVDPEMEPHPLLQL